jgi:hypothetical protein
MKDDFNESFHLINIDNDGIISTIEMNHHRQESSIQRATNWFHDNLLNNYLTRKNFFKCGIYQIVVYQMKNQFNNVLMIRW